MDLAVEFEVLEDSFEKVKGDVFASLKSLRTITRTKALIDETTGDDKIVLKDEGKLTPEERAQRRRDMEKKSLARSTKNLPDDWKVKKMGRFTVLLHGDEKFAKKIVKQAEAVWSWLDKNFDYYGAGEYVPAPIIRICKDQTEEYAIRNSTPSWSFNSLPEIITHKDLNAGAGSWEFEYVNEEMCRIWFRYRNTDAWWSAPYWLKNGIKDALGAASFKGRRIDIALDDYEVQSLREAAKAGTITAPRELVQMGWKEFYESRTRSLEAACFVRFLLTSRNKKVKTALRSYLERLQERVAEIRAENDKDDDEDGDSRPKTEEEEEEMMRKRQEDAKKRESEFIQTLFEHTFGTWAEKDWRRIEADYIKSLT